MKEIQSIRIRLFFCLFFAVHAIIYNILNNLAPRSVTDNMAI